MDDAALLGLGLVPLTIGVDLLHSRQPPDRAFLRRPAALPLDGVAHPAVGTVVVDHAAGLHRGVDRRRADKAEARFAQALRQLARLRRLRDPLRRRRAVAAVLPDELV